MLIMRVPRHYSLFSNKISEVAYITLIDFDDLTDAKRVESPEIIEKIRNTICPNIEKRYIDMQVSDVDDFIAENYQHSNDMYCKILHDTYIMKDNNNQIRLICEQNLPIQSLIMRRVIKIPVYDTKEDLSSSLGSKESHSIINPFIYHKKIWGTLPYVRSMENLSAMSIKEITESAIRLNTTDISEHELVFLIEYHDCKLSTVEYVEEFFTSNYGIGGYSSVMITGENKIYQLAEYNKSICLIDLSEEDAESIILE